MHRLLIAISYLILSGPAMRAQENLILNPSLESLIGRVGPYGFADSAQYWYNLYGSCDLFSMNATHHFFSVPSNAFGYQYPSDGDVYLGITLQKFLDPISASNITKAEKFLLSLSQKLRKGKEYQFSCMISWADTSFAESSHLVIVPFDRRPLPVVEDEYIKSQFAKYAMFFPFEADSISWSKAEIVFNAEIEASFIGVSFCDTLDCLEFDTPTPLGHLNMAYYYFDDFSLVEIPDTSLLLELPNTFTPNADGQNDEWHPRSRNFDHFELQVFNRYGALVFQSQGEKVRWDGLTLTGENAVEGVYVIQLVATDRFGEVHNRQEMVHLFR